MFGLCVSEKWRSSILQRCPTQSSSSPHGVFMVSRWWVFQGAIPSSTYSVRIFTTSKIRQLRCPCVFQDKHLLTSMLEKQRYAYLWKHLLLISCSEQLLELESNPASPNSILPLQPNSAISLRWTCRLVVSFHPSCFFQAVMLADRGCIFMSFCESFKILLSPGLRMDWWRLLCPQIVASGLKKRKKKY